MGKRKKILTTLLLMLAVLLGLFAATRYSSVTTWIPFTGRIFALNPDEIDRIFIQNGTTGEQVFFETSEEKAEISKKINDLRYRFWIPAVPVAKGGWSYRIAIEANGKQYSFAFTAREITVNGVVYLISGNQLKPLILCVD